MTMFFSITYAGIDEHIAGIREELRNVERLEEELRQLCKEAEESLQPMGPYRECLNDLKSVKESMQKRMDFLNSLIEDTQQMIADIGKIIDDM